MKVVIKRDSRKVKFNKVKIENAIRGCIADCMSNGIYKDLSEREMCKIMKCIINIPNKIENEFNELESKNSGYIEIDIETIQNKVEENLAKLSYKTARQYAIYREQRKRARDKKELDKIQKEIIDSFSDRNSNANMNENTHSGKESVILEQTLEQMALNLLPEELSNNHINRESYIHDLPKFATGVHNCCQLDYINLLKNGATTGQGDISPAKHWNSFIQLLAVYIQIQSQCQFGGCSLPYLDSVAEEYVRILIADTTREYFYYFEMDDLEVPKELSFKELHEVYYDEMDDEQERRITERVKEKMHQGCQALITNLCTLISRSGGQLPFSSINVGYSTSEEGLLFTRILLEEMDRGIGRRGKTATFPIICFLVKNGINKHEGDKGYSNYKYAIEVSCRRFYPCIVNGDWSVLPHTDDPFKQHVRMGCRTSLAYDINANSPEESYRQLGRGNIAPQTIGLPLVALRSKKIKENGDSRELLDIFWNEFNKILQESKEVLDIRYGIITKQPPYTEPFMYQNGTMLDADKCKDTVEECMKHNTLAIGYVGVAEMCKVLFGKYHCEDEKVLDFAVKVITHIKELCDEWTRTYKRNYSVYATPAESLAGKVAKAIKEQYGVIEGVSDREYVTNSHHVPVWIDISPFEKVDIESRFAKLATGGNIFHYEIDGTNPNLKALVTVVNYALDKDIPYMRLSHKQCTCLDCGYSKHAFMDVCEECGSDYIETMAVVTGYLVGSVEDRMNKGKQHEVMDRRQNK